MNKPNKTELEYFIRYSLDSDKYKRYMELYEEIERLNNIINKVYKYLDEKKDVPEWWDTDFMICMDILKGGDGDLKRIFEEENKGCYEIGDNNEEM